MKKIIKISLVVSILLLTAIFVTNTNVKATSRFILTVQDGGAVPTGNIYQSARVNGTSFTITSTAGVGDTGVQVYYQIYEQLT